MLRGTLALGATAAGGRLLAACGEDAPTTEAGGAARVDRSLLAAFPRDVPHVAAGVPTRLPYLIADEEGVPLTSIAGPLTFTVTRDEEPVGDPLEVAPRSDGVPRAYLPFEFTFPETGLYEVRATLGASTLASALQVYGRDEVGPPLVGEALPPVTSPTTARSLGVDPLCTRVPACPFHDTDLAEVVGSGTPVVLLVSSPAYCQTGVCGPILDLLVEESANHPGVRFLHSEVYKNPKEVRDLAQASLAPVPDAYLLRFEPALFVADGAGTVVARADVVVDRSEMRELLSLVG
jgi:hypothetical protein